MAARRQRWRWRILTIEEVDSLTFLSNQRMWSRIGLLVLIVCWLRTRILCGFCYRKTLVEVVNVEVGVKGVRFSHQLAGCWLNQFLIFFSGFFCLSFSFFFTFLLFFPLNKRKIKEYNEDGLRRRWIMRSKKFGWKRKN